jgi:hypothetical protein
MSRSRHRSDDLALINAAADQVKLLIEAVQAGVISPPHTCSLDALELRLSRLSFELNSSNSWSSELDRTIAHLKDTARLCAKVRDRC